MNRNNSKVDMSRTGGGSSRSGGGRRSPSSTSSSSPSSCVSSEAELQGSNSPEATSMVLAACPRCLMYVMLAEGDAKCPKCGSQVLLNFLQQDMACRKSRKN